MLPIGRHDALHRHIHRAATVVSSSLEATKSSGSPTGTPSPISSITPFTGNLTGVNIAMDDFHQDVLWWSLGIMAMTVLLVRLVELGRAHMRHLTAMSATSAQQTYFSINHSMWWPKVKKHILYAPLFRKRHNREIQLSSAVNIGTLPSRFHTILLLGYLFSNLAFCAYLDYTLPNRYEILAELRGRSGVLAVANMIALVILAGRNNPLITLLRVSFDTYNLLHRWMGRMVVLEAIIHTLAWLMTQLADTGWAGVSYKFLHDPFIMWGFIGTFAMILLLLTSPSILRHAFYETFLNVHIILAAVAMAGIWIHCDIDSLPQLPYIKTIVALWGADRLGRIARILWYNYSRKGWTKTTIECLPSGACRVTMHLPNHVDVKPGSHAYLRFASINPWESHPFSIAWVEHKAIDPTLPNMEKQSTVQRSFVKTKTDISFVIHAQTGMTRKLHNKALACSPTPLIMRGAFEGPYAGHHSLSSYGHCVMFAGSSGITHHIPFIDQLVRGYFEGTVATRRITLIWVVRDLEQLEWVRIWMDKILSMPARREILQVKLFVTRPKNPREISSPSSTVQMFPGRPNVKTLLQTEVDSQIGAMCVTVCGPGSLGDNVREAVREEQYAGTIDFVEESFTW